MDGMFCPTHNVIINFQYTAIAAPPYQKYLKPQIFSKAWLSNT